MADERQPLLSSQPGPSTRDENSDDCSPPVFTVSRNNYGSESQLLSTALQPEDPIKYTWNDINVFTNTGGRPRQYYGRAVALPAQQQHILKNVSGVANSGELLAIMGSSGAGKTTLLNALTFRCSSNVTVSGLRCINGVPISSKSLTTLSAYVQQDDLFIGNLTVLEHLTFQALVRMDKRFKYDERMQRVHDVIAELSLTQCQDTQIGIEGRIKGISGGEKKRLSFAAEVLTNPLMMFCDEPTSGLDSFMAQNVIQVLKGMALTGKTVICTIHQPSSEVYGMFDKILLMSEGRTAFLGSRDEADAFFKSLNAPCPPNYNPADYYVQMLAIHPDKEERCRNHIKLICDGFERSDFGVRVALEAANTNRNADYMDIWFSGEVYHNPYKASWCAQFRAVLWRSWLSVMKEPLLIKVRLLQTIIIALILGAIYFGQKLDQNGVMNINGVLFIFLTNMTFQNVFAVVNVFCSELPIFLREHRNGMYRTEVYFLCKTLAELPIFLIIPILFTAVCYFMIGLNSADVRFFIACGIVILVSNVATSFGYLISCASSSVSMALSIGPPLIIPFLLFGGFFLNVDSVPAYFQWLAYLSWFRFGNEALMINQWHNVTNINCPNLNSTCPRDGRVILEVYSFSEANFNLDLVWLAALIVGFRILAYMSLVIKACRYE